MLQAPEAGTQEAPEAGTLEAPETGTQEAPESGTLEAPEVAWTRLEKLEAAWTRLEVAWTRLEAPEAAWTQLEEPEAAWTRQEQAEAEAVAGEQPNPQGTARPNSHSFHSFIGHDLKVLRSEVLIIHNFLMCTVTQMAIVAELLRSSVQMEGSFRNSTITAEWPDAEASPQSGT